MKYEQLSSYELWGLIKSADQEAFAYVFTVTSDDIFKYGQKFTKDCELIEDVIQDVFVHLWEIKSTLSIHSSIRFYLYSAFRREMIKRLKENHKHQALEDYHTSLAWQDSFQEILIENQITQESSRKISSALDNVSNRQKEAIYLRYFQDMPYEEISELMGIKVSSLYNLVQKGLKTMKQFLTSSDFTSKAMFLFGLINIDS